MIDRDKTISNLPREGVLFPNVVKVGTQFAERFTVAKGRSAVYQINFANGHQAQITFRKGEQWVKCHR